MIEEHDLPRLGPDTGVQARPIFSNPSTLPPPPGYSQIVEVSGGRTVYIAGQVTWDHDGSLVGPGDFEMQVEQVFRNLELAVQAHGGTLADLIKISTFLTDISNLPVWRKVRDRHIPPGPGAPTSTLVEVSGLFRPEFLIEMEAIAWLPR